MVAFSLAACPNQLSIDKTPTLSGTISISYTGSDTDPVAAPQVGQTLKANTDALEGEGENWIAYRWIRGEDTQVGNGGSTYIPIEADIGSPISLEVSRVGYEGTIKSNPTPVVVAAPPPEQVVLSGTVSITGKPIVGATLKADTSKLDGTGTISYQWIQEKGDPVVATNVGEGKSEYTTTVNDLGATIKVKVRREGYANPTNSEGAETPITSPATAGITLTLTYINRNQMLEWINLLPNGNTKADPVHFSVSATAADIQGSSNDSLNAVFAAIPAGKYVAVDLSNVAIQNIYNNTYTSPDNYTRKSVENLVQIVLPSKTLFSLGKYAFTDCTGLSNIIIPETVKEIGESAFSGCTGLTSLTIPSLVTSIGINAFKGCTGLATISMQEGLTSIGEGAFEGCSALTGFTIPASVTSIGQSAFSGCVGLSSISIPAGVTSIGSGVFKDCTGLTSVTLPEDGALRVISEHAFEGCTGLTQISIPQGLTKIEKNAFTGCTNLKTVILQAGMPEDFLDPSAFLAGDTLITAYEDDINGGAGIYKLGNDAKWVKSAVSYIPTANEQDTTVTKGPGPQTTVNFNLTSSHTGVWKVYRSATDSSLADGVTASFDSPVLTLSHATDVPAGDYWVSVTEPDKTESSRLKLTVREYVAP
jgi:hypothetical protein